MRLQAPPGDEEIRRAARALFEDRDYLFVREDLPGGGLAARLIELWTGLLDWMAELRDSSPLGWAALVCLLVGILALLVWHMAWTIRRAGRWTGEPESGPPGAPASDPVQSLRAEIRAAELAGAWTAALRARFLLLLQRERAQRPGVIRRGWTNRECVRLFRGDARRSEALLEVVNLLDRAWYGRADCPEPEYRRARGLLKDVLGAD